MSSNSGTGFKNILPNNLLSTISGFIKNNKTLDFLMNRGKYDTPYGFMAIATIAAGTFTYVTYHAYANEISSGISGPLDSIQSTELFIPSAEENEEPLFPIDTPVNDEIVNEDVIINTPEQSNTVEPKKEEEPKVEEPKKEEEHKVEEPKKEEKKKE